MSVQANAIILVIDDRALPLATPEEALAAIDADFDGVVLVGELTPLRRPSIAQRLRRLNSEGQVFLVGRSAPQIERAIDLSGGVGTIPPLRRHQIDKANTEPEAGGGTIPKQPMQRLRDCVKRFEAEILREALKQSNGDVRRVMRNLGLPRKTFYDKVRRHKIDLARYRPD